MALSDKNITPELLKRNPSLITHLKDEILELTPFDGLVGAVADSGRLIITTPNQHEIYNPSLGGDRKVFLRDDLMFGDDDHIQWPQSFLKDYPHLICIRKRPQREVPFSIMWWLPDRSAFELDQHSILTGVGKLNSSYLYRIKNFTTTLFARAKRDIFETAPSLLRQLVDTLQDLLHRVEYISTNFRTMQLGVRSIQRVVLEFTAFLDYHEIYRPVLEGKRSPDSIQKMARIIGAFTDDLTVCRCMCLAKIPVWLIRPYKAIGSIRVKAVVPVQFPGGIIELNPAVRPGYPAIYRGAHTLDMYRAFAQHILGYLKYPDPFGSVRANPTFEPLPPPPEMSKREIRSRRFTPYANRKKNPAALSGGRSKFEDPDSPYLPPPIPNWRKALESVNVDQVQFAYGELIPADLGYVFPEPATFMSIQSPDRQLSFFRSWLKYREALLYRVSASGSDARPMPNSVWRTLLSLEYVSKDSNRSTETRSHKLREMVQDFLQNCLQEGEVGLASIETNTEVTWNGKAFADLGKDDFEEILWELAELNFRFELMALDSRASTNKVDRQKLVSACFPRPPAGASLVVVDLSVANHGLASIEEEERKEYVQALRKVMSSWRGEMPPILGIETFRWNRGEFEELEETVTSHYCKTFYSYFRRAPIVPRRLSHIVSPYQLPPPTIIVQDPMPNIFYDTTALAPL